jgi:short-subunit dehydrogenase
MPQQFKTALITGASSGIGRAVAIWFARRGTTVYAAARRTSMLDALAAAGHGKIIPLALDVSKEQATVDAIQQLDDDCGGLELVMANAGVGDPTPAHNSTWQMVERVLKVNVTGAAATLTAVLPRMVKRGKGTIVGVSSIAANRGLGAYSCYSGSKAFLSVFLESLRVDLHGTGVKVVCIEPGFVKSEMSDRVKGFTPMPFCMDTDEAAAKIARAILSGKRVLTFPWQHAMGMSAIGMVPAMVYEPFAKKASLPQIAMLQAEHEKAAAK